MLWPPEYTYHVNSDGSSLSKTVYQQCNSRTDRWHIGRKLVVVGIGYETQVWHSQCQPRQFLANQSFQLCLGLHARSLLAPDEARSSQFRLPQRRILARLPQCPPPPVKSPFNMSVTYSDQRIGHSRNLMEKLNLSAVGQPVLQSATAG